jgi:CRP/FNR family transcriptional regulator
MGEVRPLVHAEPVSDSADSILKQLPSSHLVRLMEAGQPMRLLRGQVLFREGQRGDACYWVTTGTLKVGVSSDKGEERVFALIGPGSVVGELAILDNRPRSATITAFGDVSLIALKRSVLTSYLRTHPSVYADLIAVLVGRLRKANEELSAESFLSVQARIARAILHLVDQVGEQAGRDLFTLPATVSQHDIGAMASVARESVSRTLSEWRRQGIVIRGAGKKLSVKKSKLQKEAKPSL